MCLTNQTEETMSEKKLNIDVQQKVNDAYNSFEQRNGLEPNPFLYTRIEQRIEEIENPSYEKKHISVQVLQPILMSLLIAVALFGGIKIGNLSSSSEQVYEEYTTEYLLNDMEQEYLVNNLLK